MSLTEHRRVAPVAGRSRMTWTPFRAAWVALVVAAAAFRGWTLSSWSWVADDWRYIVDADSTPFLEYVFQSYNDHLMPAQFVISWVMTAVAPLNFVPAVLLVSVFAGLSVVVWGLALREIFGERMHVLIGLVVLAAAPFMTIISLWWAASMQTYPLQIFMGLSVWLTARYIHEGPSRRGLVLVVLAYLGGLLFWQKAVLICIPVAFTFLLLAEGPVTARLRAARATLLSLGSLTAVYLVGYLVSSRDPSGSTVTETPQGRSLAQILDFYWRGIADLALPSLVGGPYGDIANNEQKLADAPLGQSVLLLLAAAALLVVALRYRRRAGTAIVMVVIYVIVSWGLILFNDRYGAFGIPLVRDGRYFADILPVLLLGTLFLVTPSTEDTEDSLSRPLSQQARARLKTALAHSLTAVTVLSVLGTLHTWEAIRDRTPKPWVDAMLADAQRVGRATVFDANPPENVIEYAFLTEYARLSVMLRPLDLPLTFDVPTERFLVANADGNLVEALVGDSSHSPPPEPASACGYGITPGGTVEVPLTLALYEFGWAAEITYFTESDARIVVATDEDEVELDVPATEPGTIDTVQFLVEGEVSGASLTSLEGDASVCVTEMRVGLLQPSLVRPKALGPQP